MNIAIKMLDRGLNGSVCACSLEKRGQINYPGPLFAVTAVACISCAVSGLRLQGVSFFIASPGPFSTHIILSNGVECCMSLALMGIVCLACVG